LEKTPVSARIRSDLDQLLNRTARMAYEAYERAVDLRLYDPDLGLAEAAATALALSDRLWEAHRRLKARLPQ
jgi:hypothetical protein